MINQHNNKQKSFCVDVVLQWDIFMYFVGYMCIISVLSEKQLIGKQLFWQV